MSHLLRNNIIVILRSIKGLLSNTTVIGSSGSNDVFVLIALRSIIQSDQFTTDYYYPLTKVLNKFDFSFFFFFF